jgi:hypothetical protein
MASDRDYDNYMRQAQMAQSNSYNQVYYRNPLEGLDVRSLPDKDLELLKSWICQEHDRRTLDTPLKSPTQRQLNNSEALKHAWSEFMTVWKLIGDTK